MLWSMPTAKALAPRLEITVTFGYYHGGSFEMVLESKGKSMKVRERYLRSVGFLFMVRRNWLYV